MNKRIKKKKWKQAIEAEETAAIQRAAEAILRAAEEILRAAEELSKTPDAAQKAADVFSKAADTARSKHGQALDWSREDEQKN